MKRIRVVFAVLFVFHAMNESSFWIDLERAFSRGRTYSEEREEWGFTGVPIRQVAENLERHVPIETAISLGPVVSSNDFMRQRISEGIYPRRIDSHSSFRLELKDTSRFATGVRIAEIGPWSSLVLDGPLPVQKRDPIPRESFEIEPLTFTAALAAAIGIGVAAVAVLRRMGVGVPGEIAVSAPLTLLLGATSIGLLASISAWTQFSLPRPGTAIAGIGLFVATLILWTKKHRFDHSLRSRSLGNPIHRPDVWILAILFLLFFLQVASFPVTLWDGRSIWLFQTKRLYFDGLLTRGEAIRPDTSWSQAFYPLLFPAWMAHFTSLCGLYNERMASLGIPVLFAAVSWLFWGILRRLVGALLACSLTVGLFLYAENQVAGGYVDFFVAVLLAIETVAFLAPGCRSLAWLAAMAASLLKDEGLVLSIVIAAGMLLLERPVPRLRHRLLPFLAFVPSMIHMLWSRSLGIEGRLAGLDFATGLRDFWPRIGKIVLGIPSAIDKQPLVLDGIVSAAVVLALLAIRKRSSPRSALTTALASACAAGFAVSAMLVTPLDLDWHLSTALDRLLLHGSTLAVVAAALFIAPEPAREGLDRGAAP
jgi:hypothetical protein